MTVPRPTSRTTAAASAAIGLLLAGAALTGCSGGASGGSTSSSGSQAADSAGGSGAAGAVAAPKSAESSQLSGSSDSSDPSARSAAGDGSATLSQVELLTADRSIVFTGQLSVRVQSVAAAVARAEALTTGAGGFVFAEQTARDPGRRGTTTAQLTVKVPADRFRPTLDRLAGLGRQLSRQQSADDVTSEVVDVASRLRTQRRSVARMQALLDKATTVGEIVRVEGELSRRESDLESLEAQQAKLTSLTELATIDLTLTTRRPAPVPVDAGSDLGFLSGLKGGVSALVAVLLVVLTGAGAVLPFVLVLALLGVPVLVVLRRRRTLVTTADAPPAA